MHQTSSANPYENLYPIEYPEALYGRHEILRRMLRRLFQTNPPHSLQIVGLARFGKSSVLNVIGCLNDYNYSDYFIMKFGLERERLNKVLVVQVNCARLSMDESSLFWNLMDQQLTHALLTSAHEAETQQSDCTTFDDFARKLFAIEKYSLLIFLFDGFERVLRQAHIDVSHNLRFLLEEGKGRIAYITATPRTLYDYYKERTDAKDTAPLFSYFDPEPIYLGLLEPEGVKSFIKEPSTNYGVTFTDDDMEFVYYKGGQHPDLTRMLCKYLLENYQLPPEQRTGYQTLYNQLKRYFEPFYNIIKKELAPTQLNALVRFATYSNWRGVPDGVRDELINLGLLIYDPRDNQIHIFSEALEHFLCEEKLVEATDIRAPEQGAVPFGSQDEVPSTSFDLKVWEKRRAVQVGDKLERLSPNEWKLFTYLWNHADQTCTRNDLIQALSSNDADFTGAALDITISRLRQKIEYEPEKPRFIVTVRGQGYRFEEYGTITVVR